MLMAVADSQVPIKRPDRTIADRERTSTATFADDV
jgi:hypothetical protein